MRLRVGGAALDVEDALADLAAPRVDLSPFASGAESFSSVVHLRRAAPGADAIRLGTGASDEPGVYEVVGNELRVYADAWDARTAEAAVKAGFALSVHRQGGLLLHGAAIAFGRGALLALGPSGAGKSTLARLAVGAGGSLLSDESVVVLPGARLGATPFHSDFDAPRSCLEARLGALVTLEKAADERLTPLAQAEAVKALLAQAYRPAPGELSPAALLERALRFVTGPPTAQHFAFRKHAAAGRFWAERLA